MKSSIFSHKVYLHRAVFRAACCTPARCPCRAAGVAVGTLSSGGGGGVRVAAGSGGGGARPPPASRPGRAEQAGAGA